MKIDVIDDWLTIDNNKVKSVTSNVDKFSQGRNICDFVVFHYTAGPSLASAHNTFLNPTSKVSWHLTIDRDGSLYQLYDFRKKTWHAGQSEWVSKSGRKYKNLNSYAIGIELINAGPLTKKGNEFFDWTNRKVNDVFSNKGLYWEAFTIEQLEMSEHVANALVKKYKCIDVLGHSDISPGRKVDPGPAFQKTLDKIRKMMT